MPVMIRILAIVLMIADGAFAIAAKPAADFAIVGYLPSYRSKTFRADRAKLLTDVILFSVEPKSDGSIDSSRVTPEFVKHVDHQLRGANVRKLVTIGGWGKSDAFARVTADARLRSRCVRSLSELCERYDLAGIDVDWEHPQGEAQQEAYTEFLRELKRALSAKQRIVTVAVAPWKPLSREALDAVDRIHVMAYDNGGRHSTLSLAFDSVDTLLRQGVPAKKICLGIPFYGRPYQGKFAKATTYAELVKQADVKPSDDEANGIFFNGPELVARKVRLAQRLSLGGVMIWELGQDATDDEHSLLHAIHRAATTSREANP